MERDAGGRESVVEGGGRVGLRATKVGEQAEGVAGGPGGHQGG